MKKLTWCVIGILMLAMPSMAEMNFYRTTDGSILLETADCQLMNRLVVLTELPDDPPGTEEEETEAQTPPQDEKTSVKTPSSDVVSGISTLADILFDPADTPPEQKDSHGISQHTENLLDAASFEERQDSFITFVRDTNWKTGMHITFRDFSFFRRLKMACRGINQLTKPMRLNLGVYTEELDRTIENVADAGVDKLAQAARGHSFTAMSRLSVVGLAVAIEKENPFLLLAIDEETYEKLVAFEPEIAELFEDMYTFFKIRSVRLGEYDANTKDLIRVSQIGKGDAFHTWHIMSEYAKNMLELDRQGKLNPKDEKEIHIWRLESAMHYIKEQVRVEQRAAELAAQDPANAQIMNSLASEPKKKPTLDDKARELLKKSTEAQIKHLIRKYITK